jgi:negative regulator of sigma-B (phosphoserine phosphatase)
MPGTVNLSKIAYSVLSVPYPGEKESGDLYLIEETPEKALIAIVDGAGHGHEAAVAAKIAIDTLQLHKELSVIPQVKLCHERLKKTRGAVMALASINFADETLTWLSIGNVEGILLRADSRIKPPYESVFMHPGLLGYNYSKLFAAMIPLSKGDMLIFTTDGIRNNYVLRIVNSTLSEGGYSLSRGEGQEDELSGRSIIIPEKHSNSKKRLYDNLSPLKDGLIDFTPHKLTEYISDNFIKGSDDALTAAVKYLGKEQME